MATIDVSSLQFKPSGPDGKNWVAFQSASPGNTYNLKLQSLSSDTDIKPKFITIDNSQQNGVVTVNFGNYNFGVLPFTREDFELPLVGSTVAVTVTTLATAPINIWVSDIRLAKDQSNQLLIQQTAALTLTYAYVTYSVTTAQALTDLNKNVRFAGMVGNVNYNLLAIAGNVGNGWVEWVHNDGDFNVNVVPNGANTIAGVFTSGSPLILRPGDSVLLSSDGVNWYIQGILSYDSGDFALSPASLNTFVHGLGKFPDVIHFYLVCRTAEIGYSVGDYVAIAPNVPGTDGANPYLNSVVPSDVNVAIRQYSGGALRIPNKTTGVQAVITGGNWRVRMLLNAFY